MIEGGIAIENIDGRIVRMRKRGIAIEKRWKNSKTERKRNSGRK